jgi:HNH endonuclease
MGHGKNSLRVLNLARRHLGMPNFPKQDVWRVAAERLGRPCPVGKIQGYALLRELVQQGEFAPPKPKMPKVAKPRLVVAAAPLPQPTRKERKVSSDLFLQSYEWRQLRMVVIKKRGARCECCGASPKDGIRINVDHIKPRKLFPQLALDEGNLQVLCEACNHGKGNWDQTDWRPSHKITRGWIHQYQSPNGGWSQEQLKAIGVSWPPPEGWISMVEGRVLSDEMRRGFERVTVQ